MKAMHGAWKYANRYGYPDGNLVQAIADHHGVKPENILLGAGSGEILDVVGTTFLLGNKKVVGVDMPVLVDEAYHHFVDDPAYGHYGVGAGVDAGPFNSNPAGGSAPSRCVTK